MNKKTGLDYFSFDVDFFQDEKIQFVSARFGFKGEVIAIRLLCKIYRNGYYMDWSEDIALLLAKSVGDGCQHSCVRDVVYELLKRGFFDRSIFERFSILTSHGIQKRYFAACEKARRKGVAYTPEYMLIDTSDFAHFTVASLKSEFSPQHSNILPPTLQHFDPKMHTFSTQSKVKESKEKVKPPLTPPGGKDPALRAVRDSFVFDQPLSKAVNEWLKYKAEKKNMYKPTGLNQLLSKIQRKATEHGDEALIAAIYDAMSNNYQGIVWDRIESVSKTDHFKKGGNYGGNKRLNSARDDPENKNKSQYGDVI